MALETTTEPYRIELCFGWSYDDLGQLKTAMATEAVVTRDTDTKKIVAHVPRLPVDLALGDKARKAAQEYIGEKLATILEGVGSDKAAAAKALEETKAEHEAELATLKATIKSEKQKNSELESVLGGTEAGAALIVERKRQAALEAKAQAEAALAALEEATP